MLFLDGSLWLESDAKMNYRCVVVSSGFPRSSLLLDVVNMLNRFLAFQLSMICEHEYGCSSTLTRDARYDNPPISLHEVMTICVCF